MSGLLTKAHFKAKKTSFDSFQEYLNESIHTLQSTTLNFMILSTCPSSPQNDKILFDFILYFAYQKKIDPMIKLRQIK